MSAVCIATFIKNQVPKATKPQEATWLPISQARDLNSFTDSIPVRMPKSNILPGVASSFLISTALTKRLGSTVGKSPFLDSEAHSPSCTVSSNQW